MVKLSHEKSFNYLLQLQYLIIFFPMLLPFSSTIVLGGNKQSGDRALDSSPICQK
jgi:hypothetical protein